MLLRVLPSVYPRQPDTIHCHLGNLTAMMSQLESPEQQHLIRLIQIVAEQHPLVSNQQPWAIMLTKTHLGLPGLGHLSILGTPEERVVKAVKLR